ncbi:transient receptor potential channel pyrexia-like isoform X3 [Homarus americanus]|uniref:transient receptor potential channel pyrexia-like isoform X3 n=1 Tax=Homarus americanus TaxID=6706 RepID=UPI001C45FADF|nr:transient receptor potential channel pyrexia-like isoform X3 [Homarus americanus]
MPMEIVHPDVIQGNGEVEEEEERVTEGSGTEEETEGSSRKQDGRKEKRKPSIQRELADAIVRLASIEELKILLKCGANVNDTITQGLTPLHYAVWQRYPEAAEFLIAEGCDINARDDIGYTALHLSAEHGYIEMMEVLLKHEAHVNFNIPPEIEEDFPTDAFDEPLRLAIKHDHFEAAKVLLEHGANPNTRYFFGSEVNLVNPLNTQLLHLLLSYGANPNARDRQGFTPMMKCCRLQQGLEAVLLLISFGADVNARTEARHDYRRACLYSDSSHPLLMNPLNRSVLHYAVLSGSVAIVNLLLKQGARVNFEPEYNKPTPLDLAILKGDIEIVRLILEHNPDLDASSPIIGSPLHMACSEGIPNRFEILKLLLERGANPNLVIVGEDNAPIKPALGEYLSSNETPDIEVVNLFLRHGAEVVMQSQNRDPRGLLSCLPNLTKTPDVLITLLEAAQRFDLSIIKHSSLIDNDQRKIYLKVGQSPLPLKHLVRVFLRQELAEKLPTRIDELELPVIMKKYLLYEIS